MSDRFGILLCLALILGLVGTILTCDVQKDRRWKTYKVKAILEISGSYSHLKSTSIAMT